MVLYLIASRIIITITMFVHTFNINRIVATLYDNPPARLLFLQFNYSQW